MIVTNKNNMGVSGNNALAPEKMPSRVTEERTYEELQRSKKQYIKKSKQRAVKRKAGALKLIAVGFAVALFLVYRYSLIYNMEKDIIDVKKQISNVNAENENLKIGLLKYDNIKLIEEKCEKELSMVPKSSTNVQYIDLNKNNFKDISVSEEKTKNNIFKKIKEILF
ncbi:hypothetical protein [Clostridium massiliodielmoense]|uniref:hypothetical protein n=1 Tax=Clostridium massiliodielmoense TaxID=1776385 RepID=UPI000166862B|nr:hypothetical protein [Clostridium massiliodielmoense]EDS77816.1 conserved hypothetical protein [Clostridium botulinum C str. Eklund]KEH96924.1 hypothetical protein Z962_05395 [Clostridium botulinum C/D str. BKT12695]NEZ48482.1 hypothetical protein [Clostridium botulinum]